MSLIGSLEDLSLGDILQIISLSQKSGVLNLSGDQGEGRIAFRDGLVCAAVVKGGAEDLHGLLVEAGFVPDAEFQRASEEAHERNVSVDEILVSRGVLPRERIESICREAIEQAVYAMFTWNTGDFSFDVRTEFDSNNADVSLTLGINAQYLAMESARHGDEFGRGDSADFEPESGELEAGDDSEMSAHEMFGVSPDPEPSPVATPAVAPMEILFGDGPSAPAAEAADIIASASAEGISDCEEEGETDEILLQESIEFGDSPSDAELAAEFERVEFGTTATDAPAAEAIPEPAVGAEELPGATFEELSEDSLLTPEPLPEPEVAATTDAAVPPSPVIIIDPDLQTLEWAKETLSRRFERVHVFQRSELGLSRIRQYLVRMEIPVVLIAPKAPGDRLSGIVDARDFVRRLKQQSPRMPILWLFDDAHPNPTPPNVGDGIVLRPGESTRSGAGAESDQLGAALIESVCAHLAKSAASAPGAASNLDSELDPSRFSPDILLRLKEATGVLAAGASRGEVLPLVIRYAGEVFSRVAMFMVQDQTAVGIAQAGLSLVGGPDDQGLQQVRIDLNECGLFRRVCESRTSLASPPADAGDRQLAQLLGDRIASMAYVAPIESESQIVALLYADNLPGEGPIGDTSALEVVLHHAGVALERALLKRALAEIEGGESGAPTPATSAREADGSPPSGSRNNDMDR